MQTLRERFNDDGDGNITVYREDNDPKFYGIINAAGESKLLYHMKKHLNSIGYNLIKKRMWKDGHMMHEMQQYLRGTDPDGRIIGIWNGRWQIEGAEQDWNINGEVKLIVSSLELE